MKIKSLNLCSLSCVFFILAVNPKPTAMSQIPQGFNYQAVAHNSAGAPVMNATIQVKAGILSDTIAPGIVWEELHSTVKTNAYGVFSLVIGSGTKQAGSAQNFSDIDWSKSPLFLKIQINYQGAWKAMGHSKLWSVPYAMASGDIGAPLKKLSVAGETENLEEALFEVRNKDGQTIFAVYNEGVRIYVSDGDIKGPKGGFAIGGFGTAKKGNMNYLFVSGDSIRAYIDTATFKGAKGGFAIGGYGTVKAPGEEYLRVTRDSTRIYVNSNPSKGVKGGFAIGGFGTTKESSASFTSLIPDNYFIGHEAGNSVTTGKFNSTLGYQSGKFITSGGSNAFLGYQAGYSNKTGSSNLFLGYNSGYSNVAGSYNTFIGFDAGYSNTEGLNNTFLGSFAGQRNSSGSYNIFVGDSSGYNNTIGDNNSFVGTKAGFSNTSGWSNAFIGNYTGHGNTTGTENVFIGNFSGYSNISSGGNVFIGNRTGYFSTAGWNNVYIGTETGMNNYDGEGNVFIGYKTGIYNYHGTRNIFLGNMAGGNYQGSNRLFIDNWNADSSQVFIWGNLEANQLRLNSTVGIGTHPDWHNLSVYNDFGRGTINIKGRGDIYDYANLSLESDSAPGSDSYVLSHSAKHIFKLSYFDGTDWFVRMNIDSLGKVVINNYETGTEMLDVNGNARFRSVGSGAFFSPLNITADGTLTVSTSDISMKENIVKIDNALNKVLSMNGVYFNWKDDTTLPRRAGFIAQEMEKALPEAVFTNPVDGLKGINYNDITAVLVEAVREQQQQIELQQKEIEELKVLVNKLIEE